MTRKELAALALKANMDQRPSVPSIQGKLANDAASAKLCDLIESDGRHESFSLSKYRESMEGRSERDYLLLYRMALRILYSEMCDRLGKRIWEQVDGNGMVAGECLARAFDAADKEGPGPRPAKEKGNA